MPTRYFDWLCNWPISR